MNEEQIIAPGQKFWAAISYLGPLVFIPLFFKIKGDFVYFHNRQALVLFGTSCLFSLFSFFPIGLLVSLFGWSFCFLLGLIAFLSALFGLKWSLPIFSRLASKIKF